MAKRQEEKTSYLRVIGGRFRGHKIPFIARDRIRPTPDRVRETLFNWLAPVIQHSRCLDLFAGSGALGLEALSRGADTVLFIDNDRLHVQQIRSVLQTFAITTAEVKLLNIPADALTTVAPFTVVFLDPPFHQGLIEPSCRWLVTHHLLARIAYIYIETDDQNDPPTVPEDWICLKQKKAGSVCFSLFKYTAQNPVFP